MAYLFKQVFQDLLFNIINNVINVNYLFHQSAVIKNQLIIQVMCLLVTLSVLYKCHGSLYKQLQYVGMSNFMSHRKD